MNAMDNKSEVITLRVTPEQKKHLQALADADQRTLSNLIMKVLDSYIKQNTKK